MKAINKRTQALLEATQRRRMAEMANNAIEQHVITCSHFQ